MTKTLSYWKGQLILPMSSVDKSGKTRMETAAVLDDESHGFPEPIVAIRTDSVVQGSKLPLIQSMDQLTPEETPHDTSMYFTGAFEQVHNKPQVNEEQCHFETEALEIQNIGNATATEQDELTTFLGTIMNLEAFNQRMSIVDSESEEESKSFSLKLRASKVQ